ncbi:hypothetical protein J4230_05660 [Candidatus Woesearchaeota archaeon]|nr:hypothetical protein [Candidatus Woesearchaeota archaeon]
MSKKGVSLSLETIVVTILILVALILIIIFVLKYGGQLSSSIGQQAKTSASMLPNITTP